MADNTKVRTTNASPAVLATLAPTTAADGFQVWEFRVLGVATSGAHAAYVRTVAVKQIGGTVSVVGSVAAPFTAEDVAGWDCTVDVSANVVRVLVTGAAATDVDWYLQGATPLVGRAARDAQARNFPSGCKWSL